MAKRAYRDLEKHYTRSQFVAKLRRLADALESSKPFAIQVASERLHIPARVIFNIEHERSGGLDELEFQLRWSAAEDNAARPARKRAAPAKRPRAARRKR